MNIMKNMLYSFLIMVGFISHHIVAVDFCDEHGRTPLMNFVIKKEQDIKIAQANLDKLWNIYFYTQSFDDGYDYNHRTGTSTPCYKYLPIRRIYTTDADVVVYREQEQNLLNMIQETIRGIEAMVRFGANINAKDNAGNTVLNYCYTLDIYEELIRLGACFQLQVWVYFNPKDVTFAAIASVAVAIVSAGIMAEIATN